MENKNKIFKYLDNYTCNFSFIKSDSIMKVYLHFALKVRFKIIQLRAIELVDEWIKFCQNKNKKKLLIEE